MAYNHFVGFVRDFGSVITYLEALNPLQMGFCGYLLPSKPCGFVD